MLLSAGFISGPQRLGGNGNRGFSNLAGLWLNDRILGDADWGLSVPTPWDRSPWGSNPAIDLGDLAPGVERDPGDLDLALGEVIEPGM